MVAPLIPLAILGGSALIGTGFLFSGDEVTNTTYQTTNQTTVNNTSVLVGENARVGSIGLDTKASSKTSQSAEQKGSTPDTMGNLLLFGGLGLGAYFILKEVL